MKSNPIKKVEVAVAADGNIKARIYRMNARIETLVYDTIQDFLESPEAQDKALIQYSRKGLVPPFCTVPPAPIFLFTSPDEIREYVELAESNNRKEWLIKYADLVQSIHKEGFPLEEITGTAVNLTHMISNPNGYDIDDLIRCYTDDGFK